MEDGYGEVSYTLRKREADVKRLLENGVSEAEVVQVEAYYDALQNAVEGIGGVVERGGVRAVVSHLSRDEAAAKVGHPGYFAFSQAASSCCAS